MEIYRIINLIMHAIYLPLNLGFIILLIKNRQSSPIWKWFTTVVIGLWIMVSTRFMDAILYAFYPDNRLYRFEVYLQLISTTVATAAFLLWNLYLAGKDNIADKKSFRAFVFSISAFVCVIVGTNSYTNLFYKQVEMGKEHIHGVLWIPCFLIVYGMLFAGWLISIKNILHEGSEKIKRIIIFSLYPFGPAIAGLVRSITKVDELDFTPVVMTVSVFCLYSIVFKNNYVNVVPQSMEEALNHTESGVAVFSAADGTVEYCNKAASEKYIDILAVVKKEIAKTHKVSGIIPSAEMMSVSVSSINDDKSYLVVLTDISEVHRKQLLLNEQYETLSSAVFELEKRRENIDTYLNALYQIPNLKEKYDLFTKAQEDTQRAFYVMFENFKTADSNLEAADEALTDNIKLATETIATVRSAVSKLKEEA